MTRANHWCGYCKTATHNFDECPFKANDRIRVDQQAFEDLSWKQIACLMAEFVDKGNEERLLEISAWIFERSRSKKRSPRNYDTNIGVPPIPGAPYRPKRKGPKRGKCVSCGRVARIAGWRCSTCRERGSRLGWCACGAALYEDGCRLSRKRHNRYLRELGKKKA